MIKKKVLKNVLFAAAVGEIKEARNTFFGNFSQIKQCKECFGSGQIPKKSCVECRGMGIISGNRDIKVEILPGVMDSQFIKITGVGEAGERGAGTGDLYVRIKIKPHHIFSRRGNDLFIKKK